MSSFALRYEILGVNSISEGGFGGKQLECGGKIEKSFVKSLNLLKGDIFGIIIKAETEKKQFFIEKEVDIFYFCIESLYLLLFEGK